MGKTVKELRAIFEGKILKSANGIEKKKDGKSGVKEVAEPKGVQTFAQ